MRKFTRRKNKKGTYKMGTYKKKGYKREITKKWKRKIGGGKIEKERQKEGAEIYAQFKYKYKDKEISKDQYNAEMINYCAEKIIDIYGIDWSSNERGIKDYLKDKNYNKDKFNNAYYNKNVELVKKLEKNKGVLFYKEEQFTYLFYLKKYKHYIIDNVILKENLSFIWPWDWDKYIPTYEEFIKEKEEKNPVVEEEHVLSPDKTSAAQGSTHSSASDPIESQHNP